MARKTKLSCHIGRLERGQPWRERVRAAKAELFKAVVSRGTASQYASRFRLLEQFRVAERKKAWSPDLFFLFLQTLKQCRYADGESFRSALLHTLEARGDSGDWLREKAIVKATQAVKFAHEAQKTPRGSVTPKMLVDFLKFLQSRGEESLVPMAFVLHNAALRIHELLGIRKGDCQREADCSYLLFIRADKRVRRTNIGAKLQEKPVTQDVFETLEALGCGKPNGARLFPDGMEATKRLRALLKKAAVKLHWPQGLKFDGPHVLRHGGTQAMFRRAHEVLVEGFSKQTIVTAKKYRTSNRLRAGR